MADRLDPVTGIKLDKDDPGYYKSGEIYDLYMATYRKKHGSCGMGLGTTKYPNTPEGRQKMAESWENQTKE